MTRSRKDTRTISFRKAKDNRAKTGELEMGRLFQSVRHRSLRVFFFSNPGLLLLCLAGGS